MTSFSLEQHTQGWNDAIRAVLAKHPGLFAEGDFQAPFSPEIAPLSPIPAEALTLAEKSPEETPEKTTEGSSSSDGSSGSSSSEEETDIPST